MKNKEYRIHPKPARWPSPVPDVTLRKDVTPHGTTKIYWRANWTDHSDGRFKARRWDVLVHGYEAGYRKAVEARLKGIGKRWTPDIRKRPYPIPNELRSILKRNG